MAKTKSKSRRSRSIQRSGFQCLCISPLRRCVQDLVQLIDERQRAMSGIMVQIGSLFSSGAMCGPQPLAIALPR